MILVNDSWLQRGSRLGSKTVLGALTIGQSPRSDLIPEMLPLLGTDVEVIEAGALDGMSLEEVQRIISRTSRLRFGYSHERWYFGEKKKKKKKKKNWGKGMFFLECRKR